MIQVPAWAWLVLAVSVVAMLVLDLWAFRGDRAESHEATRDWTIAWIGLGLAFGIFVWIVLGGRAAQEYYAAYAIEKGLSLDNLFLFYVIFQSLSVAKSAQHKVLFWGILGAVGFRAAMVLVGVAALERWDWMPFLFGGILLFAAIQAFRRDPSEERESPVVKWLSEHLPVTTDGESGRFIVQERGKRVATPLLVALVAIETSDVVLAVDSVPAALAITHEPFIVYSSNILAVMGLRALYLYLSSRLTGLPYLHYGLAVVLGFAAVKIVADKWMDVPPLLSIGVIVCVIGVSVRASVRRRSADERQGASGRERRTSGVA